MGTVNLKALFRDISAPSAEELAAQRNAEIQGIFGAPESQVDVNIPKPSSPFGLMNVEEQTSPATGLFQDLPSNQVPMMQAAKQMAMSASPVLQKQGYATLKGIQDEAIPPDITDVRTFAMGADEEGKMIRARLANTPEGFKTIGRPYDPRNQYLDIGTGYVNPYAPEKRVEKQLALTEFKKKEGVAAEKFMEGYNVNLDKSEAGLESVDFLLGGLDELANSATGFSTGWGSLMKDVPMTDANTWQSVQTSVLSGLGLDKLQEMKQESVTGASGFGQLSEKELVLLTSYRGNLAQATTPKQIKKVVGKMQRLLSNARKRMVNRIGNANKRFERLTQKYGFETAGTRELPTNLDVPTDNIEDLVNKYAD